MSAGSCRSLRSARPSAAASPAISAETTRGVACGAPSDDAVPSRSNVAYTGGVDSPSCAVAKTQWNVPRTTTGSAARLDPAPARCPRAR